MDDEETLPEIVWGTKLYIDYFYERSTSLVIYTFFLFVIGFLRIFGDVTILLLKVRKFHKLSGLEVITMCLISVDILMEIAHDFLFVELYYHQFHSKTNCNIIHFTYQYVRNFMRILTITIVILSKFKPEISKVQSYWTLLALWIISSLLSYIFKVKYVAILTRMQLDNSPHHICYPHENHWSDYFDMSSKLLSTIPSIFIFVISILFLFWRKGCENQNRDTLHYGVTVAGIFCFVSVSYIFRTLTDFGWGIDYTISLLNKLSLALNSFIYCYFHRVFYKEALILLKLTSFESQCHERLEENEE